MVLQILSVIPLLLQIWQGAAEIGGSSLNQVADSFADIGLPILEENISTDDNKLKLVKPVGAIIAKNFVPLTEIPPPRRPLVHHHDGRRHLDDCCTEKYVKEVHEGGKVEIWGDYYEDRFAKTVATVIFPDHIDHKHFEVTTQVPYLTVGVIEAIGYHPSTAKSEHPAECEKIYQDHIAAQYSDETQEFTEESLEMARMPMPRNSENEENLEHIENMYDEFSN